MFCFRRFGRNTIATFTTTIVACVLTLSPASAPAIEPLPTQISSLKLEMSQPDFNPVDWLFDPKHSKDPSKVAAAEILVFMSPTRFLAQEYESPRHGLLLKLISGKISHDSIKEQPGTALLILSDLLYPSDPEGLATIDHRYWISIAKEIGDLASGHEDFTQGLKHLLKATQSIDANRGEDRLYEIRDEKHLVSQFLLPEDLSKDLRASLTNQDGWLDVKGGPLDPWDKEPFTTDLYSAAMGWQDFAESSKDFPGNLLLAASLLPDLKSVDTAEEYTIDKRGALWSLGKSVDRFSETFYRDFSSHYGCESLKQSSCGPLSVIHSRLVITPFVHHFSDSNISKCSSEVCSRAEFVSLFSDLSMSQALVDASIQGFGGTVKDAFKNIFGVVKFSEILKAGLLHPGPSYHIGNTVHYTMGSQYLSLSYLYQTRSPERLEYPLIPAYENLYFLQRILPHLSGQKHTEDMQQFLLGMATDDPDFPVPESFEGKAADFTDAVFLEYYGLIYEDYLTVSFLKANNQQPLHPVYK